jgi:hypothetical protein
MQSNEIDLIVQNPPTHCQLPGILAINDVNPDGSDNDSAQNTPADPRVNIKQLYIAEPYLGAGVNKLVFTLQVAPSPTLTTPPPNSQWFIIWNRQTIADDGSDRFYVAMVTDATGTVSYEYGNFGPPLPIGGVPPPNANTPTKLGNADSGSFDFATGVITITLSDSVAENIGPGQSLKGLNARTYLANPNNGPRSQNFASDITGDSIYTLVGNAACQLPVNLVSVKSRMSHGSAGTFDIDLTAGNGIECRNSGGNYSMVFTFAQPLTAVSGASVTSGTATIQRSSISSDGLSYVVKLSGVTNAQRLTITLTAVADNAGDFTATLPGTMGVLIGDTNADGFVNSADIGQTKSKSGQAVDGTNFREDLNADGFLNSADIGLVKSKSGTALP